MTKIRIGAAAALLAALAACGGASDPAARAPLPALETHTVASTAFSGSRWDGVVEAVQRADLSAQTAGRVLAVEVDVNDHVRAGDVLVRLSAVEQQAGSRAAQAQLRAAEAAAAEAGTQYRRFASLADGNYVSRAQLDQARAARDSAVAARDAARAQLAHAAQQAGYTVVRAPFAGVIGVRHVEPGESVAPGQPLVSLHAPGALRIEVDVPQSQADAIRTAGRAQVLLDDGRTLAAGQVIVHPVADPLTHSVRVRILLPDVQPAPVPGVAAKVAFPVAADSGAAIAIAIPAGAIVQRGELSGVYVVADGILRLRQLRLGQRQGDRVEVLAGLRRGDTIAADPVEALQALAAQRRAEGPGDD